MNPLRGCIYMLPVAHGVLFAGMLYLALKGAPRIAINQNGALKPITRSGWQDVTRGR